MTEALLLWFYLCIIWQVVFLLRNGKVSYLLRKIIFINLSLGPMHFAGVGQHVISLRRNTAEEACGPYRTTPSLIWFVSPVGPPPGFFITTAWSSDLQRKVIVCSQRRAMFWILYTFWKTEKMCIHTQLLEHNYIYRWIYIYIHTYIITI